MADRQVRDGRGKVLERGTHGYGLVGGGYSVRNTGRTNVMNTRRTKVMKTINPTKTIDIKVPAEIDP